MRQDSAMTEAIRIRVFRDEKRALAEAARRRGITLSDLIRHAATEAAQRTAA